jgi:hypothetical protein
VAIKAMFAMMPYAATPVFPASFKMTKLNVKREIADASSPMKEDKPSKIISINSEIWILNLQR